MSERKWTDAQLEAIGFRGQNLLVSAAAGSGKTATLTERIIRLITDPEIRGDISRMLVVTFTKAAASELRERVTGALGAASAADPENRHLSEQLLRVGDADISTMDSFFLACVRPMFAEVGLPADFRIGDDAELEALREEAMDETVNRFFNSPDEGREEAISAIAESIASARTEDGIDSILLKFESDAGMTGIGETELLAYAEKLESLVGQDILKTDFGKCIIDEARGMMTHYGRLASTIVPIMAEEPGLCKSYVPAAQEMADYCGRCIGAIDSGDIDELRRLLGNIPVFKFSSRTHTNESGIFKAAKGNFVSEAGELYNCFFAGDPEITADVMRRTAKVCRVAGEIVGEFRRIYAELKRRRGITDHSDVAKMAAELLANAEGKPTPYGETVASRYDYIFIDEYQDTSIYQDRIFAAVASKCGRFMVGDIKQSIYRFRGGEPAVFTGYRERWSEGEEGRTLFMSENFRCAQPVVDFVNAVSRYMFPYGGIPFEDGDLLIHGRNEPEGYQPKPVEVCLLHRPRSGQKRYDNDGNEVEAAIVPPGNELEAEYVAGRIRHMLDHETLPDGSPVRPQDIAVMLRGLSGRRQEITEIFARYGIPLNDTEDKPLLERPEILLLRCILTAVDDPAGDVALAGAMRSAVFGFTLGDLAQIKDGLRRERGKGSLWDAVRFSASAESSASDELRQRCAELCEKLNELQVIAGTLTASAFVYRLIHDPQVMAALEIEGGAGAAERVTEFYELTRGRDQGLYEFLEYLRHLQKTGNEPRSNWGGEGVSLITVHHSKGLEFPVCFLMGADKLYNRKDSQKPMILDRDFGIAMKLPDDSGLVRCDNILRRLAAFRSNRAGAEEEMRVLYVAMTRARERLIVTGVTADPEKELARAKDETQFYDGYTVGVKNCYMDMILEAIALYGGGFAEIRQLPYSEEITEDDVAAPGIDAVADPAENDNVTADAREILSERLGFEYRFSHLRNIPSKLTVSRLYPEILDEYDDSSASVENHELGDPAVPRFMQNTAYSPADAGNAAHVFLQFCDFQRLREYGVGAELCRLVEEGFMSPAEGEAANLEYLESFRKSGLFREILEAQDIRREFRFNAAIPAGSLSGDEVKAERLLADGVDVIVQGVIDIVFTDKNGRLVLADYKTDRLTEYELAHKSAAAEKLWKRHGDQLGYYAIVCEKLFGRKPDEVVIYSMPLGETV